MGLFRSKNNARLLYCLRQGRENQDCMQRQRPILSCIAIFSESIEITRQNTTFYMVCEAKWSIHVPKTMLACSTFFDKKERESRLHAEAATDFMMYCHLFQKVLITPNRTHYFTWFVRPNGVMSKQKQC